MNKKLITISEAAHILGVSIGTVRRWDKNGLLKPIRLRPTGHRRYDINNLLVFRNDLFVMAKNWALSAEAEEPLPFFYCSDSLIFQTKLIELEKELQAMPSVGDDFSLITSVIGEIGNNSFDHNMGLWPDVRGIFFAHDLEKKQIILADRGRGILSTLKRVRPELNSDKEALRVAFTEKVSGRAPENRGNGLKYVRKVVTELTQSVNLNLYFRTGIAGLNLRHGDLEISAFEEKEPFRGCLALINF